VMQLLENLNVGGAQKVVSRLVRSLDATRFEPIVCTITPGGALEAEIASRGIEVVSLDARVGKLPVRLILKVGKAIKRYGVRILQSHLFIPNVWSAFAPGARGTRFVTTEHELGGWKRLRHCIFEQAAYNRSDAAVFVSEAVRDSALSRHKIGAEKIHVIPNGVDIDAPDAAAAAEVRRELGLTQEAPLLLTVGRLSVEKGHAVLLAALAKLRQRHPEVRLAMVGTGALEADLRSCASELHIEEAVRFLGQRHDVGAVMSAADVFVLPSLEEGMPLTLLEAMGKGLPCVCSDVGGVGEVVEDGASGLLVQRARPGLLAERLLEVLDNVDLRQRLGRSAAETIGRRFTVERMTGDYERLYESLL